MLPSIFGRQACLYVYSDVDRIDVEIVSRIRNVCGGEGGGEGGGSNKHEMLNGENSESII